MNALTIVLIACVAGAACTDSEGWEDGDKHGSEYRQLVNQILRDSGQAGSINYLHIHKVKYQLKTTNYKIVYMDLLKGRKCEAIFFVTEEKPGNPQVITSNCEPWNGEWL